MENPTAVPLAVPPKSAFRVQVLVAGSYSQKSLRKRIPVKSAPVPIYPLPSMENPTATYLLFPPKSAFCVQELVAGSYSQKSLRARKPGVKPVPIYPLLPMENPTALHISPPPKLAFRVQVSCAWLLIKPPATRIAIIHVFVFI